jgi:hypothetical protein
MLPFILLGFSAAALVSAQGDFVINKVDIPDGGTIAAGTNFLSFANATISDKFVTADHTGSYELMAGPKDSNNNTVVDVMTVNQDSSVLSAQYLFSRSLPSGPYHFRVNVTNDGNNSVRSDTFQVTAHVFDCLTPPSWTNITSPSDPNFRSLRVTLPQAGDVTSIGKDKAGEILVAWDFVDYRNFLGAKVSNTTLEFVNDKTGEATGKYIPKESDSLSVLFPFAGTDVSPGAWRIRANYTNPFENGGKPTFYLSEVMFLSGPSATEECDGIGKSSKSGGSHNNGASGTFEGSLSAWLWPALLGFFAILGSF